MGNRNIFRQGEANEWFRRNQAMLEQNSTDEAISLLCEWLQPFISEIRDVLEVGCGSGHRLNQLTESLKSAGYGVEPSSEAIRYISESFPLLKAKIGYGDDIPFAEQFDLVHLGFFLYLVDRELYIRCISEADRLVKFGGFLSIIDFETPYPFSNRYMHKEGANSYKQNNSDVFVASGLYSVINKYHFSHANFSFDKEINERVSLTLLYKEPNSHPLKG